MKRFIPTIIAIVLIIFICIGLVGAKAFEKYSYSSEKYDLNEYYNVSQNDEVAVVLQNEILDIKGKLIEGSVYFDFDTVKKLLNNRFYVDENEGWLIYTTPTEIHRSQLGTSTVEVVGGESSTTPYKITVVKDGTLYIALDYVKRYANFSYELFENPNRITLRTKWGEITTVKTKKKNNIRYRGGVKSEILRPVDEGEELVVLEEFENWVKVKTNDGIMGFIENKVLTPQSTVEELPVADYVAPDFTDNCRDHKINMGWHPIYTAAGNDSYSDVVSGTVGLNVLAPTWYKLTDNNGNYTSFASADYVKRAHADGIEVWPVLDNLSNDVTTYEIMSYSSKRADLINRLINDVTSVGADGINLDFELLPYDAGAHYVQFIRELSIECRQRGLVLSVDNYVPRESTAHYNRKEQGLVADYVVIMGYDEHWGGSEEAGSVASIGYVSDGITTTIDEGVPSRKIINGIPFYTRVWKTSGGSVTSEALGMDATQSFISRNEVPVNWDADCCQNYGEKQIGETFYQVWVEDAESIKAKLNVMDANNIGGVAEWSLGLENKGIWSVINEYVNR